MCSCKSEAQVVKYCKYNLNWDVEKNPGRPINADPNITIAALYSQDNELICGKNTRQ